MKQIIIFLLIIITVIIVPSCNKDDNDSKSKTDLLTSAAWKYVYIKVNGLEVPIESCYLDNTGTFFKDFKYVSNPGSLKCDPSEVIETGIWSFSTDEKNLIVDGDSSTIATLSSSSLVITSVDQGITTEISFKH